MATRLADRIFRASPRYEAVDFDHLSEPEQRALAPLRADGTLFGILRPREPGPSMKSISRDAAELFLALIDAPAPMPAFVARDGPTALAQEHEIGRLVLAGVLELETSDGFVSGSTALSHLGAWLAVPETETSALSAAALRYGAALPRSDRLWLSGRLYGFNRSPVTPRQRRTLEERGAVALTGLDDSAAGRRLVAPWRPSSEPESAWLRYGRIGATWRPLTHKLYICPKLADLATTVATALGVFERCDVSAFKVARSVGELLRPDRFVVYLADRDALMRVAGELGPALQGTPAQGVPFTALIDQTGLLSWGMDPPPDASRLPWQGPSWRRWLTDLMAAAIVDTDPADGADVAMRAALTRVSAESVDPATWVPAIDVWGDDVAAG